MSIVERFHKLLPSWLTADEGGLVAASLSWMGDDFLARTKLALMARFPSYCPDDAALAAIGRDRRILRGINEPSASYAARLIRALDDHATRGNPFAMLEQLQAYLQAACTVRTVDRRGNWFSIDGDGTRTTAIDTANWDWDTDDVTQWSRFWVIIYPVGGTDPWAPSGTWGSPTLWGDGLWGHSDLTIGTTATRDQVAGVKSIIREWKPAGTTCEWIIIAFNEATFTPAGETNPGGTWRNWSNGAGAPIRLASARYWRP